MPLGLNLIGALISMVAYGLIIFTGYRVFLLSNDIAEMKEMLRDIRRNTDANASVAPSSPEALVRAVNTASYAALDEAIGSEQPR